MPAMNLRPTIPALSLLAAVILISVPESAVAAQTAAQSAAGQSYETPEAAVIALIEAVKNDKLDAMRTVLGPGSDTLLNSGDRYSDSAERTRFLAAYDERHEIMAAAPGRMTLRVGNDNWPLPLPLVRTDGRWRFDAQAGAQELINRRIGRNEIAAIRTALAYVDAQKIFFVMTGHNGIAQYARHLLSSPGKYDGLYWPATEDEPKSPLEPLVAQAREEGYPVDTGAAGPRPYHGYHFRILTAQGTNSPKGARSYIDNGRMTKGFALAAWPASYGISGIMCFIVNQDEIVFQKDLGPHTAAITSAMTLFDPDLSWAQIDIVQQ